MKPQDRLDELVTHITKLGVEADGVEVGGLIIPSAEDLSKWVHQLPNISKSPEDSCLLDMDAIDETMIGLLSKVDNPEDVWLWHTHPGGNIGPSRTDLDCRVPGVCYLVVAIPSGIATRY